jgi:putative ABC transport system permease protein
MMTPLHRKLLRDFAHMRGQVIALTLVLACGISTYVTMRSAFVSLERAQQEYYSDYRFADVFARLKRAPEHVSSAVAAIPGVAAVQTRVVFEVTLDVPGLAEPATGRLISIPDGFSGDARTLLNGVHLREGRWIDPVARDLEVIASESFASANRLGVGSTIDAVLNGKWKRLRIAGIGLSPEYIYEIRPSQVFPDNRRFGVLWMSRSALGAACNLTGAFNDLSVTLTHGASETEVIARMDRVLERYGSLGAYGRDDQISYRFLTDELGELRAYGWVLPVLFLGIVAFLVHSLLSRLVGTQRSQIAVLKAFGYTNFEIGVHYLQLALATAIPGAAFGCGLGLWLASGLMQVYARYFHFPSLELATDAWILLVATGIAGGAACLGAMSPVRRAVALAPAEAMHPDTPASARFRAGLLERWAWLRRLLATPSRMIARNLGRRPWRAAFTVLAVALAIAIVVSGRYGVDAVKRLVAVQFELVQREDVTVVFESPRSAGARFELASLDGVERVEAFREVPVRLRFEHRSRLVGVLALDPDGDLRRPVDGEGRPVWIPPEGLVLNAKLAEILGAKPGDWIEVEVLEGARPRRRAMLAALAEEPIGLGAYMHPRALQRLLREGETASGAYLKVDPVKAEGLYTKLKRLPEVTGVSVRKAMLDSFWKTFGDSVWVSTAFLVGFASVIAFGIVYNGARIALSERGNELACLRVLGFTLTEIGKILIGEQAILTAAAIPFGFAAGYGLSALLAEFFSRDLFRLPMVVNAGTYGFAAAVIAVAALISGLVVARRLRRMDLTAVLKSRE